MADDLASAARASDVIATCTTAAAPFLGADMVSAGAFIAAVGADSRTKNEIMPDLMGKARVVADLVSQGSVMGDLHHALAAGTMGLDDVHAELHEVLLGSRPGRTTDEEIILFDSTGIAVQDVAACVWIYERAIKGGGRLSLALGAP